MNLRKYYSEPELEVKSYQNVQGLVLTISTPEVGGGSETPDLGDEDLYNPFG
jgi:hypothetical protein